MLGESGSPVSESMIYNAEEGPRIEPWGTPELTEQEAEVSPSRTTRCCLSDR